jgi:TNF receptor-associated factor 2/TNF receptor-associated factor 3
LRINDNTEGKEKKKRMAALANAPGNPLQCDNEDWHMNPEASGRSYTPTNDMETSERAAMNMEAQISRQVRKQLQGAAVEFRIEFETLKEQVSSILAQQAVQHQPLPARGGGAYMVDKIADLEGQVAMLRVRVAELELQLQASLATTRNGVFLWRIPNVTQRRLDAKAKRICSIYSPPFYTSPNGYKLCIRTYLNGDGIGHGSHLSIFIVVMRGEYDALLPWPFRAKISLVLLDQGHRKHIRQTFKPTPGLPSFNRPHSQMNVASGCPRFAPLEVLEDPRYVNDDVMFVKCIVDVSSLFVP